MKAAEEICGERGPSGLKLREIARRVGIEPASIYNHFSGLGGVLSAVVKQSLVEEAALLNLPKELNGAAAIRELCFRTTTFLAQRKGIVRLALNDLAEVHDENPNAIDENEPQLVRLFDLEAALLAQHLKLGHLKRSKLGEIVVARRSMELTLLSLTWLNGREADEERIWEVSELVTAFMLGLPTQLT